MAISGTKSQGWRAIPAQYRKASDILTSTLAAFLFSSHPKRERDREAHLNYYTSTDNREIQLHTTRQKYDRQNKMMWSHHGWHTTGVSTSISADAEKVRHASCWTQAIWTQAIAVTSHFLLNHKILQSGSAKKPTHPGHCAHFHFLLHCVITIHQRYRQMDRRHDCIINVICIRMKEI